MNKTDVIFYYESSSHEDDVKKSLQKAYTVVDKYAKDASKLAIVFDIDETSLNHYQDLKAADFPQDDPIWDEIVKMTDCKAIQSSLEFYEYCISLGYKVFFVSARYWHSLKNTKQALKNAGYVEFEGVFVFPRAIKEYKADEFISFKARRRAYIESLGYSILLSIGDQPSDLIGGFTKYTCELPNYLYGKKSAFIA